MAKITNLPNAGPLSGTEPVVLVQAGETRKSPIGALVDALAQPKVDQATAQADIATAQANLANTARTQSEMAALVATAQGQYVSALTTPVPANGTVQIIMIPPGALVYRVQSGAWVALGWLGELLFKNVGELLAWNPGTNLPPTGTILRTRAEGYAYEVAPTNASNHHVSTSGGVKLYVQPVNGEMPVDALGARGDNTGNDAPLFLLAALTGFPIRMGRKDYRFTTRPNLFNCKGIAGSGKRSRIFAVGTGGFTFEGSSSARLSDVVIKDFAITGDKSVAFPGIHARYVDGLDISGVTVSSFGVARTFFGSGIAVRDSSDVNIKDNRIKNSGYAAIDLHNVSDYNVNGNKIYGTDRYGIYMLALSAPGNVTGNLVRDAGTQQGDSGIMAIEATGPNVPEILNISGNTVDNSGDHGIHIFYYVGGSDPGGEASLYKAITITGNVCLNHGVVGGGGGIVVEHGANITISGNTCHGNWKGIEVWCGFTVNVSANTVISSAQTGIGVLGAQNTKVDANIVRNSGTVGGTSNNCGIFVANAGGKTVSVFSIVSNIVTGSVSHDIIANAGVGSGEMQANLTEKEIINAAGSAVVVCNNFRTTLAATINSNYTRFTGGVATIVKDGPPSDADFAIAPNDGTIFLDRANKRICARLTSGWYSANLTPL